MKIKTNYLLKNAQVIITDTSGRTVYIGKKQDIMGTKEIPLSLNNGVFMMNIKVDKDTITKKVIVNK